MCVHAFISLSSLFPWSCMYVDIRSCVVHNRKLSVVMLFKLPTLWKLCACSSSWIRMTSGLKHVLLYIGKNPLLLSYNQKDFAVEKICGWNLWAKAGSRQGSAKVASWPAFRNSCDTPNRQSALGTLHMLKKMFGTQSCIWWKANYKITIHNQNKPCEE